MKIEEVPKVRHPDLGKPLEIQYCWTQLISVIYILLTQGHQPIFSPPGVVAPAIAPAPQPRSPEISHQVTRFKKIAAQVAWHWNTLKLLILKVKKLDWTNLGPEEAFRLEGECLFHALYLFTRQPLNVPSSPCPNIWERELFISKFNYFGASLSHVHLWTRTD
jgi:hypothetical protein